MTPNNVPPSVDLEEPVISRAEGGAAPVAVPLVALHLIEDAAQAHDQCRAVVHMALSLAEVYVARAAILAHSPSAPIEIIGESSAETIEYLGDLLSNMDAVEDGDEWLAPIFDAAQARWPRAALQGGDAASEAVTDEVIASAYERDYCKAIKEAKSWAEFIPEIRGGYSAESVIALLGGLVVALRAALPTAPNAHGGRNGE